MAQLSVYLYVANVVCYIRIAIVAYAWFLAKDDVCFASLFFISIVLDGVDGWAARRFKQVSAFGAWLDVIIDLWARAMLWGVVWPEFSGFVVSMEWAGFLCNYSEAGKDWKNPRDHPLFIRMLLKNGFKNFWGGIMVTGTHFLPLGMFAREKELLCSGVIRSIVLFLWFGKAISFYFDYYFITRHIRKLVARVD
ncbi:uncharacterized protein LOC135395634 [Ornithodoros turicata]|uniref:uncharacterized protein LOC135395634 n=1 Tax=Ornithodoros turicata TaxID=34597 RepID=UPI003139C6EF